MWKMYDDQVLLVLQLLSPLKKNCTLGKNVSKGLNSKTLEEYKIEFKDAQEPWIHSPVAALKAKAFLDGNSDKWNVKAAGLVISSQLKACAWK